MNFFPFILCVLAAASMATKSGGNSSSSFHSNNNEADDSPPEFPVNSLARMSISHLYYQVGLDMSNIDGIITMKKNASNTEVSIEVCPEKLIGYGGISEKEELQIRMVFPKLFKYDLLNKSLKEMAIKKNTMSLKDFRVLCLECAEFPEAIIAVDVAILIWITEKVNWLPEAVIAADVAIITWIAEKIIGYSELMIDSEIIDSVCLLSVHPEISVYCERQITRMLGIFLRNFHSSNRSSLNFLLNLLKFIDSHAICEKVKTIVTSLYTVTRAVFDCRLILGTEDPFLATLEETLQPKEAQILLARRLNDFYPGCYFKFYSKGQIFTLPSLFSDFVWMLNHHFIRADIIGDGILHWKSNCNSWKNICFAYSSFPSSSLFIVLENSPPIIFWAKILSCKNLNDLKELLKTPDMKYFILYHDVTIMESNIQFSIAAPSKQLGNQDPHV